MSRPKSATGGPPRNDLRRAAGAKGQVYLSRYGTAAAAAPGRTTTVRRTLARNAEAFKG
jgi:hypothetical protein